MIKEILHKRIRALMLHFRGQEVREDLRMALNGRFCQQVVYLSCIIIHIMMIFVFYGYGVDAMMYYNIGSVTFFTTLLLVVSLNRKKTISLMDIACAEITVFSVCSTIAVGWGCGFMLYIIACVPAPFFMPNERLRSSIFTSIVTAAAFIGTKIYTDDPSVLTHEIDSSKQITKMYIFNSVLAMIMIIFMAVMFVLSRNISTGLMNEKNEELKMLASIDPLTQLFNRRAMTEYIKSVHEAAEESGRPYSVVIADIDNFKKINDNYGHSIGDEVLRKVSSTLSAVVPSEGYICRWGGEEVLIVLPDCREERAAIISEQIRSDISHLRFTSNGVEFGVSMTFGLTAADLNKDFESSINLADDYLYCGKENGKNIVVTKKIYENIMKSP